MSDDDDVTHALYGLRPQEFTAHRDAAAKEARAAGDRPLATEIAALRKPTVSAWLMNLLVREDSGLAPQLRALADGMRAAEASLDGEQLRELNTQRRQLVASLAGRARRLGAAAGQRVGESVVQELERTLTAALADPDVTAEVLSGRLTGPREYAGFGAATASGPHLSIVGGAVPDVPLPSARAAAPVRERRAPERRGRLTIVETAKPAKRTEPATSAKPTKPAKPAKPAKPTEPVESAAQRRDRERELARAAAETAARAESERARAALNAAQERQRLAQDAQAAAERELEEWQAMAQTTRRELARGELELRALVAAVERSRAQLDHAEQRQARAGDGVADARAEAKEATAKVRAARDDVTKGERAIARLARTTAPKRS